MEPEASEEEAGQQAPARRRPTTEAVEPGEYTVRLVARGTELSQTVTVIPDKRR